MITWPELGGGHRLAESVHVGVPDGQDPIHRDLGAGQSPQGRLHALLHGVGEQVQLRRQPQPLARTRVSIHGVAAAAWPDETKFGKQAQQDIRLAEQGWCKYAGKMPPPVLGEKSWKNPRRMPLPLLG